ncbi:MAG: hypothetical protein ACRD15_17760 [Vicinamibacterales bacterium]
MDLGFDNPFRANTPVFTNTAGSGGSSAAQWVDAIGRQALSWVSLFRPPPPPPPQYGAPYNPAYPGGPVLYPTPSGSLSPTPPDQTVPSLVGGGMGGSTLLVLALLAVGAVLVLRR